METKGRRDFKLREVLFGSGAQEMLSEEPAFQLGPRGSEGAGFSKGAGVCAELLRLRRHLGDLSHCRTAATVGMLSAEGRR